jgi:hypothetical protein
VLLTTVLPEPSGRSLKGLTGADYVVAEAESVIADARRNADAEPVSADVGRHGNARERAPTALRRHRR